MSEEPKTDNKPDAILAGEYIRRVTGCGVPKSETIVGNLNPADVTRVIEAYEGGKGGAIFSLIGGK